MKKIVQKYPVCIFMLMTSALAIIWWLYTPGWVKFFSLLPICFTMLGVIYLYLEHKSRLSALWNKWFPIPSTGYFLWIIACGASILTLLIIGTCKAVRADAAWWRIGIGILIECGIVLIMVHYCRKWWRDAQQFQSDR